MICAVSKTNPPHPREISKGKQKNTTPVDDSKSDTNVSTFIPTRNRFDLLEDFDEDFDHEDSTVSPKSDRAEREESSQETVPLFKCPTVRYIWGT